MADDSKLQLESWQTSNSSTWFHQGVWIWISERMKVRKDEWIGQIDLWLLKIEQYVRLLQLGAKYVSDKTANEIHILVLVCTAHFFLCLRGVCFEMLTRDVSAVFKRWRENRTICCTSAQAHDMWRWVLSGVAGQTEIAPEERLAERGVSRTAPSMRDGHVCLLVNISVKSLHSHLFIISTLTILTESSKKNTISQRKTVRACAHASSITTPYKKLPLVCFLINSFMKDNWSLNSPIWQHFCSFKEFSMITNF